MRLVEIVRHPTGAERDLLVRFVDDVTAATGARPLSDHLWLDLTGGDGDAFLAVRVADPTGTIALAQISATHASSTLEAVVHPAVPDADAVREDAVDTAIDAFLAGGGGDLSWWVDDPTDRDRDLAAGYGLAPVRRLHEMRRPLPHDERATVPTRAFQPGRDADEWLAVNNRAFAGHGEQGGWTRDTLALRMAEPWFDPDGFRLHEREGRLAAFCWTKLHHDQDPVLGEIYVIAVDPDFHGLGLGTQLTLAGLDAIADRGVTVAGLFVDADNEAAIGLYRGLGFTLHRTRQAFAGTVVP
jgi:mycothiol synthase